MPDLSVIIPNYNGIEFLQECLESLEGQKCSLEIIIVDNGSSDGSVDYIKKKYGSLTLVENQENMGFSKAVNQGINKSSSPYIFLMNNDVVLEKDCLPSILECISRDENIFAVASKMIQYHDRDKLDDAGDEYTILGYTKKAGEGKSPSLYSSVREIFSASAGAAIYRRSILDEIGCFDENFFAYMEDVDISYRAKIHGYKCIYCPDAVVYHYGSATSGSRYNEFKIKLAARNNVYLPYKNMPWPQFLVNFLFLAAGYLTKYLFFQRRGQGRYYIEGLKEGFSTLERIDKVRYTNKNLTNYFKVEWLLIKNTFKLLVL